MIFDSLSNLSLTFSLEREETPMKKILSTTVIAITIFTCSIAAAKTITIEWDMSDTSNVTGYKMYYSYSSNMDPKILACETTNPDTTSLSCPNITLTSPVAYFTIAALTSDGEIESPIETHDASLSIVQNFIVITPGANLNPSALISSSSTSGAAPATIFFDGTGSSDPDGSIMSYSWDFGDGSTSKDTSLNHIYSSPGNYEVKLLVTDDGGAISVDQLTINVTEPSLISTSFAINFQPSTSPLPDQFVADSGTYYNEETGYGWTIVPGSLQLNDRDNDNSEDQSYDTNITFTPTGTWELSLPNGEYQVTIAIGDPYLSETYYQHIQIEGIPVIDNLPIYQGNNWETITSIISVNDGRMTFTFEGSNKYAKLCWIKVQK